MRTIDLRVLLVDDDALVRRALVRLLRPIAAVVDVDSAEAAVVAMTTRGAFDAIVTDIGLPGMSGIALYGHVLRHAPRMAERFIGITGDPTTVADDFRAALGERLLEKPVSLVELRRLLLAVASPHDTAA